MSILVRDALDHDRRAAIVRWVGVGAARVATDDQQVLGYCVVERTFFEQPFVVMLIGGVVEGAQGGDGRVNGADFTAESRSHVSAYRIPPVQ